jgi:3'(2'), 5'-bisphosphate nucleotidase
VLHAGLTRAFPDDVVVTEETWTAGAAVPTGRRVWYCDPLDGTEEFVRGRDDFAVMIGLVVDGVPRLGVVLPPIAGHAWLGINAPGGRCERHDADGSVVPLDVSARPIGPDGPIAAVSRSHPSRLTNYVAQLVGGRAVKRGSVGLKVAMIVEGEADLYLSGSSRMKLWDTAGPAALLAAAGGEMTAIDGAPLVHGEDATHHDGVRAWTPAARDLLRERIDEAVGRWRRGDGPASKP